MSVRALVDGEEVMEPLLTYKTAAAILDCSASKVQKMCLAGEIPIIKVGSETRIMESDLRAWMQRGRHYHRPNKCSEDIRPDALPPREATVVTPK